MIRSAFLFLTGSLVALCGVSQGTLEFNQVLLVSSTSGVVTVPSGKVWKIENTLTPTGRYYSSISNYGSTTWTIGTPNPCTGATSGTSSSIPYVSTGSCNTNDNFFEVNGVRSSWNGNSPLWVPAGSTLRVSETDCRNLTSVSYSNSQVYYDANVGIFKCGPISITGGSSVSNGSKISIIEFNVIP